MLAVPWGGGDLGVALPLLGTSSLFSKIPEVTLSPHILGALESPYVENLRSQVV